MTERRFDDAEGMKRLYFQTVTKVASGGTSRQDVQPCKVRGLVFR